MKLNVKALAIASAIIWAGGVFIVGIANLISPEYGNAFLELIASIYPGYAACGTFGDVIVGTLYALLDAAIGGFIFGWLYNLIAGPFTDKAKASETK